MSYFTNDFLDFFKELAANNNKDWFDANRKRYETSVKAPFKAFVQEMIDRVAKVDPTVSIEPRDAIFRINRDIRFSKDKTPYKTHVAAIVSPGGKKDKTTPGMYIQLGPEDLRFYGGAHMLDKEQLYNVRNYIMQHLDEFNKVITAKKFKDTFGEIHGEKNKKLPKEFQATAEQQPLLFNKAFYYFAKMAPETVTDPKLADLFMQQYKTSEPVKDFLTQALQG